MSFREGNKNMKTRKIKRLFAALVAVLTICIPVVNVSADIVDPLTGYFTITNRASGFELALDSQNRPVLRQSGSSEQFIWRLWQVYPEQPPYYIATQDGRLALTSTTTTHPTQLISVQAVETGTQTLDSFQRWLIIESDGGYIIRLGNLVTFSPQTPVFGRPTFLRAISRDTPAGIALDYLDVHNQGEQFVWDITPIRLVPPIRRVVLEVTMNQLRYTVNGMPHYFDVAPFLDASANRSMIPMRFIAEAFGATVSWDNSTRTQHISLGGRSFFLTEGVPLPDGMGTPVLINDRFFVPLRYVSQELGATVEWDTLTQTNTIIYYR